MVFEPGAVYHKPTFDNISKEKRLKILNVASNEFANKGYKLASEEVTKESNVLKTFSVKLLRLTMI